MKRLLALIAVLFIALPGAALAQSTTTVGALTNNASPPTGWYTICDDGSTTTDKCTLANFVNSVLGSPVTIASGGTGVSTLASSPFTVLSPGSQQTGTINVSSTISSGGAIVAGSGTASSSPTSGDVWASRSTSTGALNIGGSSSSGRLDYGVTASGVMSANVSLGSTGALVAGEATAGTATSGDTWASRSTTTGADQIGGSSSHATIDYGVTTGSTLSISVVTNVLGALEAKPTINSTTTLSYVPPGYSASGAALASSFHIVLQTGQSLSSVSCSEIGTTGVYTCNGTFSTSSSGYGSSGACSGDVVQNSIGWPAGGNASSGTVTMNWVSNSNSTTATTNAHCSTT